MYPWTWRRTIPPPHRKISLYYDRIYAYTLHVDDELQSSLADMLGYDDLDLITELISHRASIVSWSTRSSAAQEGGGEDALIRLMTKEQRSEALRQADLEHKSRPLGPKLADPTINYPHVYRAHEAGNTLNAFGKKYSLPLGSRRNEEKVCLSVLWRQKLTDAGLRRDHYPRCQSRDHPRGGIPREDQRDGHALPKHF